VALVRNAECREGLCTCHALAAAVAILLLTNTAMAESLPPVAPKKPHELASPHGTRQDPYYWLRDDTRKDKAVLDHLRAELAYYQAVSGGYQKLTERLTAEIIGRVKQDDSSVPYKLKDYHYYARFEPGKEYAIHARRRGGTGAEEVLVDGNREAVGRPFYSIGAVAVSSDQKLVAILEDVQGRRQFTLRFRDLDGGRSFTEQIHGLSAYAAWANDNRTVFYVENDPVTLLSTRVKKHVLGTDPATDSVVYEEKDTSFYLGVDKTRDESHIVIFLESTVSSEWLVLDANQPGGAFRLIAPRERDVHYHVEHLDGRWIIRTDWQAPNYRIMAVGDGEIGDRQNWREIVAHSSTVFIQEFTVFSEYLALGERCDGVRRLRILPWADPGAARVVASDEAAYAAWLDVNAEVSARWLRYKYSSLTTPTSVFEVDMASGERRLLKTEPVLGGFDKSQYVTERAWAPARDGARVQVSIVYRKGFKRDGTAPMLQYAYGAYGESSDPIFESSVISLLDRGFVYAIAHIRGGQEMGRAWYENGKLLNKMNTFTDFVDVTEYLVREKYAARDRVAALGGSAGGLLMGAVVNFAPDRYRAIVAMVPFVDAVTTMLDETIPLTSNEFDEWGNPKEKKFYDYILAYSPYDNVKAQAYPAMLVTTGLYDSQVQYYEPAKWVARLREMKTDNNPLLFKINMEAGHGGRSGRFERMRETAESYGFVVWALTGKVDD
jgi:oligopeptidase B